MFAFSIQKESSRTTKNLAIALFKASKSIVPKERITDIPLSHIPQNPLLSLLVAEEESFLLKEGSRHRLQTIPSFFRIRSSSASKILQHLAASRQLYFETTPLICDFFTRLHARYPAQDTQQWAELYSPTLSWKAHECSLISHAGGGLVIAQSRLFFLDESVSVQEVLRFINGPVAAPQALKKEEPVPLLQLNDHIGATALLYIRYGAVRYNFHDLFAAKNDRNSIAEKAWEKDLLDCGYIKKDSGYYCPAPQIAAALEMLLGIGWNVLDIHGNVIIPLTQIDVESHLEQNAIQIKGKAFFNEEAADILFVLRSLKEQKLFLPLGNARVGLLANHQALVPILPLLSDIECIGMTATVPKNRIGM